MKKILFLITATFLFCIFVKNVGAVPAGPSPICEIKATVKEIQQKTGTPEYYIVYLKDVKDIKTVKQEGTQKCNDEYISSFMQSWQILLLSEYNKSPIAVGDLIKTNIHFGGDENFGGYFLSDIKEVDNIGIINTNYLIIVGAIIFLLILIIYVLGRKNRKITKSI